ncbi:hypothetical protein MKZ38_003083 [Zalerion maritima]|uniref:Uncharacterized protein n=1 Tax=Zalerion maritima TaxID=339359 RepID=A0AAD5WQE1_9PEZI|nr:hypothetical protein MKZ38_003083 [Zalerion maritima]
MSRQPTFSNTIHLRDFIDAIVDDPTRENAPKYVEIQTDINIFEEDGFCSPNIIAEPIRARIHAYLTRDKRDFYDPNTFFYADGRFSATLSADNTLEISIQALTLMRHPGDVADFDEYRRHLPEQWCPMVTVIGFVQSRNDNSLDPSQPRRFTVETSVYDTLNTGPVQFSVACFLENTKRWQRVKTPTSGALLSVTAKVAGRTTDTNHLALRILDLAYLPRPGTAAAASTPTVTPPSKRSRRWEGRAGPSTPSKKPRTSERASEHLNPSHMNTSPLDDSASTPPAATGGGADLLPTGDTESPSARASSSTAAGPEELSLSLVPSVTPDSETRPHRSRHPPRKYADFE